jgi:thiosulfate/3-mercaptopyruvate sulfurtransferase
MSLSKCVHKLAMAAASWPRLGVPFLSARAEVLSCRPKSWSLSASRLIGNEFPRITIPAGVQQSGGWGLTTASVARPSLLLCNQIQSRHSTSIPSVGQAGALPSMGPVPRKREERPIPQEAEAKTVVTPAWLQEIFFEFRVRTIDASWYLPGENRNPYEEYKKEHVPGAVFFNIDTIADITTDLPHMLPSEAAFAAAVSKLGIKNDSLIVVYDTKGIFSAARVWWMFKVFGHQKVWVLDGGLPKWRATGHPIVSHGTQLELGQETGDCVRMVYAGQKVEEGKFQAKFQPHLVRSIDDVERNIDTKKFQLIDARGKARFEGTEPEPSDGHRGGHIPGSLCIPYTAVLDPSGSLLPEEELAAVFSNAGLDPVKPVVVSCRSGVSSCVIALALHRLGKEDVAIYDGSWAEWSSFSDTPVETNVAAASA